MFQHKEKFNFVLNVWWNNRDSYNEILRSEKHYTVVLKNNFDNYYDFFANSLISYNIKIRIYSYSKFMALQLKFAYRNTVE